MSGGVTIGAGNPPLNKKLIHRRINLNSHKKKEQEKKNTVCVNIKKLID